MATDKRHCFLNHIRAVGKAFLVALFCLLSVTLTRAAPKARVTGDLSTQYWMEAFDFFQTENDLASLEALRTKAIEKQPSNILVIKKVLDSIILQKDRSLLNESVLTYAQKNQCYNAASFSHTCAELRTLWTQNLDSLYFYEDSAGKIEHARRFLESKECDKALALLKEVELREGSMIPQADFSRRAYGCLGDDGNRVAKEAEVKKLRIFDNY